MLCKSKIWYKEEKRGLKWEGRVTGKERDEFCKELMGLPNCTANIIAEMELSRDSGKGKVMGLTVQRWQRTVRVCEEEPVKQGFEWQKK